MSPRTPPNPSEVSLRSERSAYAEATPPGEVTAPCRGPVLVCAEYDDRWRTPVTMAPLRIADAGGVLIDGDVRTQGLPSFGMQDGQAIGGVRPDLGRFDFNAAQRGPVSVALVPDGGAPAQIQDLEREIIEALRGFASEMETAMEPWLQEWNSSGWLGVAQRFFESAKKGLETWWDGEGDFWSGVWDWLSGLPDAAADAWDSLSSTTQALWNNRHRIVELLEALGEGAVDAFEAGIEALRDALAAIPSLSELAETFRQLVDESAEWAGAMIEMSTRTNVLAALGSTVMGILMTIPPNFWAEVVGTVGGYLIPEIILAVIFAVIAFFTAGTGGAALAARLSLFVASVTSKLSSAGRAGRTALRIFSFLQSLAGKMVDLVKALKRGIDEAIESATDVVTRIVRRSGKRVRNPADMPCFSQPPNATRQEFLQQLQEQENAINNSDLSELMRRRELVRQMGTEPLRDTAAQATARSRWIQNRTTEIMNGGGVTRRQAQATARDEASLLDATHVLDIVAGGDPSDISGLQNRSVNRSLGSQWKDRVGALDEALANQNAQGAVKAHVRLRPC